MRTASPPSPFAPVLFLWFQGLGGTRKPGSSVIFQTFQGLVEVETLTKKKVRWLVGWLVGWLVSCSVGWFKSTRREIRTVLLFFQVPDSEGFTKTKSTKTDKEHGFMLPAINSLFSVPT